MRFVRKTVLLAISAFILLAELGCGDQYRPVANPVISPGGQPQSTHFAWVLNNNSGGGDGSVTELDVSGDTSLSVNSMGVGSISEAFPGFSLSLYVANSGDDTVNQYLPTLAGAITTISLLPGSHPIALTSTTTSAMYVLNQGFNSACQTTGSISIISTATLSVSSTTCVGHNPTAMVQSPTNGFIYIINQGDNNISVFNPAGPNVTGIVTPPTGTNLGSTPASLAVNAQGWVFVVAQGQGSNPGTLVVIAAGFTNIAGTSPLGVNPTYAFIDPNRNRLYVTNSGDNSVSVFDASSVTQGSNTAVRLLAKVAVGTQPTSVTALLDGTNFYVANAGSSDVTVVSQSSFTPLSSVPLPAGALPVWIASDPTSAKVYVADSGTFETTIIQTSNNTVTQNIQSPLQNPNCTSSCPLQTPVMILTQ